MSVSLDVLPSAFPSRFSHLLFPGNLLPYSLSLQSLLLKGAGAFRVKGETPWEVLSD
jgi:hypothetical protein